MKIGDTIIEDSFAEAFRMRWTRLIITAADAEWALIAAREATGYGASIIACDAEAGIERPLSSAETPDVRPGAAALFFGFNTESLARAVLNRVGQCVLTCATTAVYDGVPAEAAGADGAERFALGKHLRFFGDGFQKSKVLAGRRFWRLPVMDGEFLIDENAWSLKGVAGGNFLVEGRTQGAALAAARAAVRAIEPMAGVITPFPGGIARSGSKVGSRYKALKASTNEAFCPTLRARAPTQVHPQANAVYEVIVNGVDEAAVARAMRSGIVAACTTPGVEPPVAIAAGNYGGRLGKFHFRLHEVLDGTPPA
jgi:formylmethanofuran--tetrahydromethanopterin N-formyltransferase